jgi:putative peptidoglycan lipid II flippase
MSLIKAMATVGGLTAVSRVAGFIRDVMTAAFLGGGPVADAFVVALKLPNFFRNVTAEGAFSVSFVPIYTETLHKEGEQAAAKFAGQAFSVMALFLSLFTAVIVAFMPYVMFLIAPGFDHGTLRYDLAVNFSRVTFPYLLLISLCSLVGGMLNAHEKFGPFASTSVYFNLCQIIVMLAVWWKLLPDAGAALAWSVTVSGVIQLVRLLWYLRKYNIPLTVAKPAITDRVRRLYNQMVPGILGAGIIHVNLFADIVIASLLPVGGIAALYYADRLFQLPLGVVGIAVGTALLPLLTKALAAENTTEARDLFNRALEYCLFFTVPAATALMVARLEIITVLFVHGQYTMANAHRTAPALAFLAFGLPAYVAVKIFSSSYWARHDTKTPVKISASMAVVNIAVALVMTRFIDAAGISFATGLAGWVQCFLLWKGLKGQEAMQFDARLRRTAPRIFLASALMGAAVIVVTHVLHDWFFGREALRLAATLVMVGAGSAVYFAAVHFLHVLRLQDIRKYFRHRRGVAPAQSDYED